VLLSLPFALRYRLAYDAQRTSTVLSLFVRTVFASLRRRARQQWSIDRGQCGAVTFVQRFGDAPNANVHFHSLVLDGVYDAGGGQAPRFFPLPAPDDAEVARVAAQVARKLCRLLEREGLDPEADAEHADPLAAEEPFLATLRPPPSPAAPPPARVPESERFVSAIASTPRISRSSRASAAPAWAP